MLFFCVCVCVFFFLLLFLFFPGLSFILTEIYCMDIVTILCNNIIQLYLLDAVRNVHRFRPYRLLDGPLPVGLYLSQESDSVCFNIWYHLLYVFQRWQHFLLIVHTLNCPSYYEVMERRLGSDFNEIDYTFIKVINDYLRYLFLRLWLCSFLKLW